MVEEVGHRGRVVHGDRELAVGEVVRGVEADGDDVVVVVGGLGLEAVPVVDDVEVGVLEDHRDRQVVVRDLGRDAVEPRQVALAEVDVAAHEHLLVRPAAVRAVVEDAEPGLAVREQRVLVGGGHEPLERGGQPVAGLDADRVGLEHLGAALRDELGAQVGVRRQHVGVVAVVGEVEPLGEVLDEHEVVEPVGGLEHAEVDQQLAAREVELGHAGVADDVALAVDLAHAVADLLGGHGGLDLAQQLGEPVVGLEVRQRHVRGHRVELRLLHGAGGAVQVPGVGVLADPGVEAQQVGVGVVVRHLRSASRRGRGPGLLSSAA